MKNAKQLFFNSRLIIALLSICLLISACKKDEEPTIVEPQVPTVIPPNALGIFNISPSETIVNEEQVFQISFTANPNADIIDESIMIMQGDLEIAQLYDNGNLFIGDEIKGDNVYSASFNYFSDEIGVTPFKVVADVNEQDGSIKKIETALVNLNVYDNISDSEFSDIYNLQDEIIIQLNLLLDGDVNNLSNAYPSLINWVESQSIVENANLISNSNFQIEYTSGLKTKVIISLADENGTSLTRGGIADNNYKDRASSARIATDYQTKGTLLQPKNFKTPIEDYDIGNRNVLIFSAAEDEFYPNIERPLIEEILFEAECGDFEVYTRVNANATIASVLNFSEYGTVVICSHGSNGEDFGTGEIVDTVNINLAYRALFQAEKLTTYKKIVVNPEGIAEDKGLVWAITHNFISDLGEFPNTLLLNNSCESTKTNKLSSAFLGKGVKTYLGYSEIVNSAFCVSTAEDVFKTMVDAFPVNFVNSIDTYDPVDPFAQFQLRGRTDLAYPLYFSNGDFEDGLKGWTVAGDGRVISTLGYIDAYEGDYMGIISTGLGFTTSSGKLSQSFTVLQDQETLTLTWNFLSEEFLSFIGSTFQDELLVSIKTNDEYFDLMVQTIDIVAADYGATTEEAGSLIEVSPGIVFDQGEVYMTGKVESTFDVSQFQDQCVTLIIECSDVGDSIYDTAILLDAISID